MCEKVLRRNSLSLAYVPDHFKTQEMCNNPAVFFLVPDIFKTQEMCNEAFKKDPWSPYDIPDHFKTQGMCNKVVRIDPYFLRSVPDWFVSQGQLKLWHDSNDWHDDDELIEWYENYKKRKAQKAKIKEELLPIAWHLDHVMDWCMSEDGKRWWK